MDRKDFLMAACGACGITATLVFLDGCSKQNQVNFTLDLTAPANSALTIRAVM